MYVITLLIMLEVVLVKLFKYPSFLYDFQINGKRKIIISRRDSVCCNLFIVKAQIILLLKFFKDSIIILVSNVLI
jgi:hypothetical protein